MNYDVIVVGGGHAGLEAVFAASKLNERVALITLDFNTLSIVFLYTKFIYFEQNLASWRFGVDKCQKMLYNDYNVKKRSV